MKRELQLKELAPYLPYGLKGIIKKSAVTLSSLNMGSLETKPCIHGFRYCRFSEFKPILRPLRDFNGSDADEEINSNSNRGYISVDPKFYNLDGMFYNDVQILLKHHFDVFGLIPAGLAIDKNTLPNPPKQ